MTIDFKDHELKAYTINVNDAFTLPITDGSANQVLQTNGSGTVTWADSGGGGGGGSMTTVKANGSQVGGADIVTLDFGTQFSVSEDPDTEINIALADDLVTVGDAATIADGSAYELSISGSAATLGGNRLQLLSTETVFNNAGADADFRVEGDTDANLLFVDASTDRVGIGTNAPAYLFDVDGAASAESITLGGTSLKYLSLSRDGTGTFGNTVITELLGDINIQAQNCKMKMTNPALGSQAVITMNPEASNQDFLVKGDTDADLLFVDASTDLVQIGKLNINGAFTLPTADGSANQVLQTNGSGTVTWADSSGISNLLEDTSPQLGGNLDLNGEDITGSGNITMASGTLTVDGPTVLNDVGGNYDFRVEGDTDTHLIFTDASTDRVGISNATPEHLLDVDGAVKANIYINETATATDGSTVTFNLSNASQHKVVLGGNRTLAVSNSAGAGEKFIVRLVQDSTGSRTVTWFSNIYWPGGIEPELSTGASDEDAFGFICISSGNWLGFVLGYDMSTSSGGGSGGLG